MKCPNPLLFLVIIVSFLTACAISKDSIGSLETCRSLVDKSENNKAIECYTKEVNTNPELAQAYIVRGVLFEEQGSFDKAIEDYGKALQIEKDQSKITSLFGMRAAAYAQSKNYSRAVEDFTNAISRGDKESDTFDLRGFSYAMLGDSDHAIADYIQAISASPDNAEAYAHLGNEYAKKEDYNKAIAEYDKAIKLVPDDASYYFNRGLAYAKKKDFDLAIRDLEQALTFNPNFGIAKELLEKVKTSELLHERLDFSTQPQVTQ
ncbi:MAG: tetratricopeptide repeat protein [Burkholderiales bacterium]|jgi:tetratricopeptide (TPR) repeat protein|nr:tetratricopeptide repeat protein [Burkholderiales bacterium]